MLKKVGIQSSNRIFNYGDAQNDQTSCPQLGRKCNKIKRTTVPVPLVNQYVLKTIFEYDFYNVVWIMPVKTPPLLWKNVDVFFNRILPSPSKPQSLQFLFARKPESKSSPGEVEGHGGRRQE